MSCTGLASTVTNIFTSQKTFAGVFPDLTALGIRGWHFRRFETTLDSLKSVFNVYVGGCNCDFLDEVLSFELFLYGKPGLTQFICV